MLNTCFPDDDDKNGATPTGVKGIMMADKPASRPIAKALPKRDKYLAQYSLPGLVPAVLSENGAAKIFESETDAENAALRAVFDLLTRRMVDSRMRNEYEVVAPAQFALALNDAGASPTLFAELYGVRQSRVMQWLNGEIDIPHSAYLVAKLLSIPAARQLAISLAGERMSTHG